jgi:hypothetical protein
MRSHQVNTGKRSSTYETRLRVEGGQLVSGQNVFRVLSGQAVLKDLLSEELDPTSAMYFCLQ